MRIRISHRTTYVWRTPAKSIVQILRVTPRSNGCQRVGSWRIDMDVNHTLRAVDDGFGNINHTVSIDGPLNRLTVSIDGDVETFDTAGVLRDAVERFPPEFYLRASPLAEADDELRKFAEDISSRATDALGKMHALMQGISQTLTFEPAGAPELSAAAVFEKRSGSGAGYAHLFIACARHAGVPARYVAGYVADGQLPEGGRVHAWAEAWIPGLGWVGFDPAARICPAEAHVSVARGLDRLSAAPVRAARSGGDDEDIEAEIRISQQQDQRQS
jgi:transglutaminase-like putative cysteine protease